MDARDILIEAAGRPITEAEALRDRLTAEVLVAHPGGHDNSVAWLLWHAGRQLDVQLAQLTGQPQVWLAAGFAPRFALGELGDSMGWGHSRDQARAIVVRDAALLLDYLATATDALTTYVHTLTDAALDEIVDDRWDPPVSRGVRLVSLIDDAAQHVGQAAYAVGIVDAA